MKKKTVDISFTIPVSKDNCYKYKKKVLRYIT